MALNFHPQSWNEILKGRREVTLNLVERAVLKFAFNPVYLYTGDGPLVRDENLNGNLKILTVVTDHAGRENILHVPTKAQAGYAAEAAPLEVVRSLMNYSVPGMEHRFGTFRSFEIEGESMTPSIESGAIVICRYIQPDYWEKQIQASQAIFPPPLREKIEESLLRIETGEADRSLQQRTRDVLLVSQAYLDFQNVFTVDSELREIDGETRSIDVIYLGMSKAWFVDASGRYSGFGAPAKDGWNWTTDNQIAATVRDAIEVQERRNPPALVTLPLTQEVAK